MSFSNYIGKIEKVNNNFIFNMRKTPDLKAKYYLNIANPTIDNSFKQVFYMETEIAKSFLNSIIFPRKERIIKVTQLSSECSGELESYSRGSAIMDYLFLCRLEEINENFEEDEMELYLDDNELIVDIEMQIGINASLDNTYMKYLKKLISKYSTKKILILSLLFSPNSKNPRINQGNVITFGKEEFKKPGKIHKLDDCIIYQIHLNFCLKLLNEGNEIYLFNESQKLEETGKEWIKFLTMPIWCGSKMNRFYAFPPLDLLSFSDENIKTAIEILVYKEENPEYESEYERRENFINHIENFDNAVQKNEIYEKILQKHGIDYEEEVKKEMEKENKRTFKYPKKK